MLTKIKNFLFVNTSTKQTIAKNTFWLLSGEILGRILKLVIVVVATRKLGVEGWGLFSYALAFVSLFFVLGDFGINTFITKEMSKDNINKHKYLATSMILRISIIAIFFTTALLFAPNFGKIKLEFNTVLILGIFFVFESMREFAMSINRSLEKMEVEGFSKILVNLIIMILGLVLLIKNTNPISLAISYMAGSVISTIYIFWSIRKELIGIDWKFSRENFKIIYSFSWPIIIISFFGFLFSLDTIMLGQMKSATEVGLYTMAQRLLSVSSIIPGFVAASLFPILSRNADNNQKLGYIFEKIMTMILAIGIPMMLIGIFFSKEIVLLVVGPLYLAGVPVFSIIIVSILASFPNIVLTNLIFSKNLQKKFIIATTGGVILNILLNLWLIPKYGAIGAAISTTIAELLIMCTNWRKMKKIIPFNVTSKLGKIILSNMAMIALIIALKMIAINFIVSIAIAITFYVLVLKILKESTFNDFFSIVSNS